MARSYSLSAKSVSLLDLLVRPQHPTLAEPLRILTRAKIGNVVELLE